MTYYLTCFSNNLDGKRIKRTEHNYEQAYFKYVQMQGKASNLIMYSIENGKRKTIHKL